MCVVVLPVLGKLQHQQQVVLHLRTHQLPCCMLLLVALLAPAAAAAAAVTSTAAANAARLRCQFFTCLNQQLHAVAVQRCQQQLLANIAVLRQLPPTGQQHKDGTSTQPSL